jgi:carbamoyltransferase
MYILGINGGVRSRNQDASACLLKDGKLIAAAEEERFLRVKFANGVLPENAIRFCLEFAKISIHDISYVVFPGVTYKDISEILESYFKFHFGYCPEIKLVDHHMAHAASVFYTSGFDESMIITADFTGEGKSTTLCYGCSDNDDITVLKEFMRPDSLGFFYSIITQYLGFRRDSDEYKVMGISAYGKPKYDFSWLLSYSDKNNNSKANANNDGRQVECSLNRNYLRLSEGGSTPPQQEPLYSKNLLSKLKRPRLPNTPIDRYYKDIAKSAQEHLEKVAIYLLEYLYKRTGGSTKNLCLAGGIALNVVMNQKLMESKFVEKIHLTSVPGDNGLSLGSAILVARENGFKIDKYQHAFWGPEYTNEEIEFVLTRAKVTGNSNSRIKHEVRKYKNNSSIAKEVAQLLSEGKIIAWFQGRMELGQRALGSRSILSDPRDKDMKDRLNKYVKFREDFRPFAPSVLEEKAQEYFINCKYSPFMVMTYDVNPEKKKEIPTPIHVDNTSRVQTVSKHQNNNSSSLYYNLIKYFEDYTGVPVITNTSLNVRNQPICLSPVDALSTFYSTGLDGIAIGDYLLLK